MRVTFLGTGGSDGYPAAFCGCERCARARVLGGPNIRRRSSLLVNHDLLLDFGPDVPASFQTHGLSAQALRWILVTHGHDDHWLPVTLKYRHPRYGLTTPPLLTIVGSGPTLDRLGEVAGGLTELMVETAPVSAGSPLDAGSYQVLPLRARHAPGLDALLYVVSDGRTSVLYATDTGALPPDTWDRLASLSLDAAIFDATFWGDPADEDHLTIEGVIWHAEELRRRKILKGDAPVFATHFAHRSQPDHATLAQRLNPHQVTPAYDGLVVDLPPGTAAGL